MKKYITIYDSTLRDGAQGPGVNFSLSDKVRIAEALDAFGVAYVEGGWPGANPKDTTFFKEMKKHPLRQAKLVAFGATRKPGQDVAEDRQLKALLKAGTPTVTIFGKAWLLHVRDVLKTTPEENLAMISDSVKFLVKAGREVIFDAEHFFNGYKENSDYAMRVLKTAKDAGATTLVLCDTNGATLPYDIGRIGKAVKKAFPSGVNLGIHCHNDSDCAVAGSLMAYRVGFNHIQGTVNGLGERCGNANICSIIPAIGLKIGEQCLADNGNIVNLCALSQLVNELAVLRENPRQPYVGSGAFSHKAGTHVNAVSKNALTFEHISPESVGNRRHILMSEMGGASNVILKAKDQNIDLSMADEKLVRAILDSVKKKEAEGYSFETASASFKLLVQKHLHCNIEAFDLDGFRVIIEKRGPRQKCLSEATIKLKVGGKTEISAAEGEGPVNALDSALRRALSRFFPQVADMQLQDFKVRILDGAKGTAAQTQVLIESTDGKRTWTTVGLSENIIEASWQAILDSVEYFLAENQQ